MPLKIWQNHKEPAPGRLLWKKEDRGERYVSRLALYETDSGLLLKIDCEGKGSFECRPEGIGIHWHQGGTGPEHYFQTLGAAIWLELQGIPCIHANALATDVEAVGIIAPSRTGKTTLTAALLEAGMKLMTDDMLALHRTDGQWWVHPGWPQLRMWPDAVRHYMGTGPGRLPRVHERFDKRILDLGRNEAFRFQREAKPLKRLYLLERRTIEQGEIKIEKLSPGEALVSLLQNSILADAYKPLGLEQKRLKALAELLSQVTVARIRYPSGMHHLDTICRLITSPTPHQNLGI